LDANFIVFIDNEIAAIAKPKKVVIELEMCPYISWNISGLALLT
jgi:hypothetical protein